MEDNQKKALITPLTSEEQRWNRVIGWIPSINALVPLSWFIYQKTRSANK